jgi:hypothetical protein
MRCTLMRMHAYEIHTLWDARREDARPVRCISMRMHVYEMHTF